MAVASLDNWSGSQAEPSSSSNDPLVEQINIIKGYLKQARDAMRFEEVGFSTWNSHLILFYYFLLLFSRWKHFSSIYKNYRKNSIFGKELKMNPTKANGISSQRHL